MRTDALLAVGLALATGGVGFGQFQPVGPRPPALPGGFTPAAPGAQPAPTTQSAPVALPQSVEIKTALPADHPWLLKPEHGAFFIMVKSYVRPAKGTRAAEEDKGLTARELAEGLASEIRETYRVQAFLFEYISEERKAEVRQVMEARQRAAAYSSQLQAIQQRSRLQGMEFMEPDNKMHVMTHNHRDQIGVLVGPFQSDEDAKKALVKLKTWPTPKNEILCDRALIVANTNGKQSAEAAAINPYASAFVVPNPTVSRAHGPKLLDPFVVRLNEGQAYNMLKAKKDWTLVVKTFSAPYEIANKNADTSLMRRPFANNNGAEALARSADQAEELAKALRQLKGKHGEDLKLEPFVLHTREASIVSVGQFDGPDDPNLVALRQTLGAITLTVGKDRPTAAGVAAPAPSLFDTLMPMPIPRPAPPAR
ncbi:MAG: SPOR domain-containing protein [Gemmataceae bacterium]|nr:SPOR domain-containing protein [Gemmataceae bacterium]